MAWNIKTLKVEYRRNFNNEICLTIFNDEEKNKIECLSHDNPIAYSKYPKFQVVGVWKQKKKV